MKYISSDTNIWIDFNTISRTDLPFRLPCTYIMYKEALRKEIINPPELLADLQKRGLIGVDLTIEEFFYADELSKKYADDANEVRNIDSVKNADTSEHKTNYMIDEVSKIIVTKSKRYLEEACNFEAGIQVILYENNYGLLASI